LTLWLVRAGREGEQERGVLQNNIVAIGWNELPNLSTVDSLLGLNKSMQKHTLKRILEPLLLTLLKYGALLKGLKKEI
jgi:hypothetical protein